MFIRKNLKYFLLLFVLSAIWRYGYIFPELKYNFLGCQMIRGVENSLELRGNKVFCKDGGLMYSF